MNESRTHPGDHREDVESGGLKATLDEFVHAALIPATAAVASIYGLFIVIGTTLVSLPEYQFRSILIFDCCLTAALVISWMAFRRRLLSARRAHHLAVFLVLVTQTNVLWTLWVIGKPHHTAYLAMITIGAGAVFLSWTSMWVIIGFSTVGWVIAATRFYQQAEFGLYPLFFLTSAAIAVVIHRVRLRSMLRIHELREGEASNRRRLVRALKESEGRYKAIVEAAVEGIGIVDPEGVIVYVNPRVNEILGYDVDSIVGKPLAAIVHPEDREWMADQTDRRQEIGDERYETRLLRRDGSEVWCAVSANPLFEGDGTYVGSLGLVTDISAEKAALESLRKSEKHYRTVFEGAFDSIMLLDPETEEIYDVNHHACETYGFEREEFIGMSLRALTRDIDQGMDHIRQTLARDEPYAFESTHYRKDGSEILFDIKGSVVDYRGAPAILSISREVTEQRKLEKKIREQFDFQRVVIDALPHPFYVMNARTHEVVLANEASGLHTGAGRVDAGRNWDFPTEVVRKRKEATVVEQAWSTPSGKARISEVHASPIFDDNGEVTEVIQFSIDVTERKVVEEARLQYSSRLETLREVDRAILAALSPSAVGKAVVTRLVELGSVDGVCLALREPGGASVSVQRATRDSFEESVIPTEEYVVCDLVAGKRTGAKDGERDSGCPFGCFPAGNIQSSLVENLRLEGEDLGQLFLFSGSVQAFGEDHWEIARELADRLTLALRQYGLWHEAVEERRRFEAIFERLPGIVLALDRDRRILFTNHADDSGHDLFSGGRPGMLVSRVGDFELDALVEAGDQDRWVPISLDGEPPSHFEATASRLADPDGRDTGFVVVLRDVTREREVRDQVMTQQRLAAVGQLASGIAHDFNNILQIILMNSELMRQNHELPEQGFELVTGVIRQTKRASTLVRQILDFSRKSVVERKPVDLGRLATETAELLRRTLKAKVRLSLDGADAPEPLVVDGDSTLIQQVITNLVLNSQDAMDEGGEVRIALAGHTVGDRDEPPLPGMGCGNWVSLTVADEGCGMTPEVRARAFEPFFTTKETGKGTGLGLAQVYGIVRQHDGFIDAVCPAAGGTTFSIHLPRIEQQVVEPESAVHPAIGRGRNEVIVIVEDDETLLQIVSSALENYDYEVHAFSDAEAAAAACARLGHVVDVLISDLAMPKLSGAELLQRVRPLCPRARFILMTGHQLDDTPLAESDIEFDLINKPFTLQKLVHHVTRVLS